MKAKHIFLGLGLSLAAGLTLNASLPGGTSARPVVHQLPRDATQWNEYGILYAVRDYESVGIKPVKVEVIDLGPSWTPLTEDLAPFTAYAYVNGVQYPLLKDMATGHLMATLPTSAFTGFGDSLSMFAYDRTGKALGCFSFGFFY